MSDSWWFTRTYTNTEESEDQAQTRYENDCDAARKGE
jgi:hypothetical protein